MYNEYNRHTKSATKKQQQEIDFLIKWYHAISDNADEYIAMTVRGGKPDTNNSLFQAKRKLDIDIKMWRVDIKKELLTYAELLESFDNCDYIKKIVKTIQKNL